MLAYCLHWRHYKSVRLPQHVFTELDTGSWSISMSNSFAPSVRWMWSESASERSVKVHKIQRDRNRIVTDWTLEKQKDIFLSSLVVSVLFKLTLSFTRRSMRQFCHTMIKLERYWEVANLDKFDIDTLTTLDAVFWSVQPLSSAIAIGSVRWDVTILVRRVPNAEPLLARILLQGDSDRGPWWNKRRRRRVS